ncbi:two-component regulator propeller domain-containing protein [Ochrovirga pacifica]|uniref:two-component regulator propeller domain-containing protein n=1 Tax=Ochrovirga pacifica TaxID=1042376 RepID=UPI00025591FD|nr:two-component regulator propeller domain-containing protein [Ochrovirga pacifica]
MRFEIRILFFLIFHTVFGQKIKFKSYTTHNGLSNNSVVDIENGKDGGLWIATWDGLNYFDGQKITTYKHQLNDTTSIAGNQIFYLKKDACQHIWILTNEGKVSRYVGNHKFENYDFKKPISSLKISVDGNAMVYTEGGWHEFINNGFLRKNNSQLSQETYPMFRDRILKKYPDLIINDVLKDPQGNVWIATRKNGIYRIPNSLENLNNGAIEHYVSDLYAPYSFNSNEVVKLHLDVFGNIWLAQKDGGLSMAYQGSESISSVIHHPVKYPHLPNETIRAVTKDFNGEIWLGYYTQGLYYFDYNTNCYLQYKFYERTLNPDWDRVRSLFTSSDGSVWVGTYAGLLRIYKDSYQIYQAKDDANLPNNRNYYVYEDKQQFLWIACWGGVAKFNLKTNKFEAFKGQKSLEKYHIRNVRKHEQQLLVATELDGVILLDLQTGKSRNITLNDGILGNSIYSVYKDKITQNIWIASLGGLSIYHPQKGLIKNITEQDGLPSHMVYGLLENNQQMWLSTTKGIATVDKNTFKIHVLDPNEGWQAPEFSEGSYYQDEKGVMFFGGVNGLNYFSPNNIQFREVHPNLRVLVNNKEHYPSTIHKKHSENELNVSVTPIVFPTNRLANKNFLYQLKGYDNKWKTIDINKPEIQYKNIPTGVYTFYVKDADSIQEGQKFFNIEIEQAFYESPLFYGLMCLLMLIIFSILIYVKNKNALLQQQKLEEKIAQRTKVIQQQKQDLILINKTLDDKNKEIFFQKEKLLELHNNLKNEDFEIDKFKTFVLSEFQNPINKIVKVAHQIKESEAQKKLQKQSLKLINLISEWNYLDHVKDLQKYKTSSIDLSPILMKIIEKLKGKLHQNNVQFSVTVDKDFGWVETDLIRFKLIMQYLFNDICKYADEQSKLSLQITHQENQFQLSLTSSSLVLVNSWESIFKFSPYHKALKVLLQDVNGTFTVQEPTKNSIQLSVCIPMELMVQEKVTEVIAWKHLNLNEKLDSNKQTVLIFCEAESLEIAHQLLENNQYNLLFETAVQDVKSALQQIEVHMLVFYQAYFTKEFTSFLQEHKKDKTLHLPKLFISEEINYTLQEQSVEYGIDAVIQLPASESFIFKKISSLLQPKKKEAKNKLQKEIFQILTNGTELENPNDKMVKNSLEIIKKELSNPLFNVEMLIELLGISRVKCYRLFKEVLNQSPSDVITSLRFQKAAFLLENKKLNVSEVSFECGFNDPKYFARSFKKYFGMSPKEYKKSITTC